MNTFTNQDVFIVYKQKSLPLLRQSLMLKEMVIDGIRPPQPSAVNQQPTVVLANQQQTTVKIIFFLVFVCALVLSVYIYIYK